MKKKSFTKSQPNRPISQPKTPPRTDAAVQAVRYDCGSYQTIFAQVDYDCGQTIYMTAAAKTSDYQPIIDLMQNVWPTGATPETAAQVS